MVPVRQMILAAAVLATAIPAAAQGDIRHCVDENGRRTYTNVKEAMAGKCTVVSGEVSVVSPPPLPAPQTRAGAAKPAATPVARADPPPGPGTARPDTRRRILEEELESEQKRLAEARQKLSSAEPARASDRTPGVLERIKPFVEAVEQHEKNIIQLRRELSGLK